MTYSGFREKKYILDRMKQSKALIFPSVWYEGLPIVLLEAFSTGTPVIISNLPNLNQIVINGYNGLHFEPNNYLDLKRVLVGFIEELTLYKSLYDFSRKTFESNYTDELNYQSLISIYNQVMKNAIRR